MKCHRWVVDTHALISERVTILRPIRACRDPKDDSS